MKSLKECLLNEVRINVKNAKVKQYKYHPKTKYELLKAIEDEIKLQGNKANLNCIDTSKITDMSYIFNSSNFDGDISEWNVSKVKDMYSMFGSSKFNGNISGWDVSSVEDMCYMFAYSNFNGDLSKWNVSNVKNTSYMFYVSPLDGNEPDWFKNSTKLKL